ncbi:MAG: hypothetical protein WCK77_08420 [Verrucomicrobiota bacterium]
MNIQFRHLFDEILPVWAVVDYFLSSFGGGRPSDVEVLSLIERAEQAAHDFSKRVGPKNQVAANGLSFALDELKNDLAGTASWTGLLTALGSLFEAKATTGLNLTPMRHFVVLWANDSTHGTGPTEFLHALSLHPGIKSSVFEIDLNAISHDLITAYVCYSKLVHDLLLEQPESVLCLHGIDPANLNVLDSNGWNTLAGMLILAFPEARWVVIGAGGHSLESVGGCALWALCDPSGVREAVKCQTITKGGRTCFPLREKTFVALDEEQDYAFFFAYTAYRFGYRAATPLSWEETKQLLGGPAPLMNPFGTLEDIFLQYADQPDNLQIPVSYLESREAEMSALGSAGVRIMVTSGGQDRFSRRGGDRERRNLAYVRRLRLRRVHVAVISKPLAGMFRLWAESGVLYWMKLERRNWCQQHGHVSAVCDSYATVRAPGFEWPPGGIDDDPGNHSSPGRLLMVARTLLDRAERLLNDRIDSVEQAVKGAVLATEALEMLGDRTPTMALEALAVKHQFEVLAECQFIGVRHNIEVEQRIDELRHEIAVICNRFARSERTAAARDAEVAILGKLVKVFQDYNQFDEEMECLFWQRLAMGRLLRNRHGFAGWIFGWVWRYLNRLVRHPLYFLGAILGWLLIGSVAFSLVESLNPAEWSWGLDALSWSLNAFFAGNAPDGTSAAGPAGWVTRGLTVCGLFHFGVFISYVYTLISRK